MKALLDSSVLVAAHLPSHPHYAASRDSLRQASRGAYQLVIAAHSLAETYSVLTRLPLRPRISPQAAWRFLQQNVLPDASVVSLSPDEYMSVLQNAVQEGWIGGMIYDALIARAAEKGGVDRLVTLNPRHFERVWPARAARIALPETQPPPQRTNDQ